MKQAMVALITTLLLSSCLSAPRQEAKDQQSSPGTQAYSEAMTFEPCADALFFRFDLLRDKKKEYVGESSEPLVIDGNYAVFGCYLGNGFAMDSNGNLYLDPFKLYGIDPKSRFSMKHGQESIQRTDEGYKLKGFRDGVLQVETATLDDRGWIKVKAGAATVRNLQLDESGKRGVCARGAEKDKMSATDKEILISGVSSGQSAFTLNGNVVELQGGKRITAVQRDDSYWIKVTDMFFFVPQGTTEYELAFAEGRIVFKKAGRVLLDLAKRPEGLYDAKTGALLLSVELE